MAAVPAALVSSLLADSAFAHAQVLAGARGLSRAVESIAIGEPGKPGPAFRDALMLVGPKVSSSDLALLIRQAASAGASAIMFVEPASGSGLDASTLSRADAAGLPVIALPRRTDWHALARTTNRVLLLCRNPSTPSIGTGAEVDSRNETSVNSLVRRLCSVADEEASALYWRTIGPIDLYDRQHGATLVDTLAIFFSWDENVERTAEALVAHRHTIRYRLGRIADISGLSPYRTSDKVLLWLGLQLRELLRPAVEAAAAKPIAAV